MPRALNRSFYPTVPHLAHHGAGRRFPWSKIVLLFLMVSVFLIFASTGLYGAESVAAWTEQISRILVGTAVFTLAAVLLVWAARLFSRHL